MLKETSDLAFKKYLTRKTQGWFRRFGRDEPAGTAAAAASPAPACAGGAGAGAGGPGAATPARPPLQSLSDDEEDAASLVRSSTRPDDD